MDIPVRAAYGQECLCYISLLLIQNFLTNKKIILHLYTSNPVYLIVLQNRVCYW